MRTRATVLLGLAAAVALAAGTRAAAAGDDWGTLKGQVVFDGDAPKAVEIKVDKDQDHCLSKGKLYSQEWAVNKDNNGVRWVVVFLDPPKGKALPVHPTLAKFPEKVEIDQPCCQFEPHVIGLREGQVLVAKNTAPVAHNVNWAGIRNANGNVILPPGASHEIKGIKLTKTAPLSISCNIHGWMKSYVRVFDHPYFAITDKDGNFEIKNAPAGDHQLVVWHEGVGWGPGGKEGQKITVKAGDTTELPKIKVKPAE